MDYRFSDRMQNLKGNAIRMIFKLLAQPDMISFAGGMPAGQALPAAEIADIADELLHGKDALKILQYGGTEGYLPYLQSGLKYLARKGITDVTLDNVLAVSGGQQGIDLTCKAFINKGDVVLVEDPTYLAVLHILKTYEGVPVGVKSNDDGIDPDDLEAKIIRYRPKFVYLVPNFSNPTGKTVPLENRKRIAEITAKHGVMLVEDDPYGELRWEGEQLPSIKSMDRTGNVIYLTSFSKVISPGMRVGLAVADPAVIAKLTIGKQATDVHTATLNQAIVSEYLDRGLLDPSLARNIPLYKQKKDAMIAAIRRYFPASVRYTDPQGGLFIWVELPEGVSAKDLFPKAVERKVAYVCGSDFYADGSGENTLRLNFSNATLEQIDTGIARLGELLRQII